MHGQEKVKDYKIIDFLFVCVDNIRVFLFIPILFVVFGVLFSVAISSRYVSQAIIRMDGVGQENLNIKFSSLIKSGKFKNALAFGFPAGQVDGVSSRLSFTLGKDGLIFLEFSDSSPDEAQKGLGKIINALAAATAPSGLELDEIERSRKDIVANIKLLNVFVDEVKGGALSKYAGLLPRLDSRLDGLRKVYLEDLSRIESIAQGLSGDAIVAHPSLPSKSVAPRYLVVGAMFFIFGLFFAVLIVFLRMQWMGFLRDPIGLEKVRNLKALINSKLAGFN